jgi:serine/threonine protein kinase
MGGDYALRIQAEHDDLETIRPENEPTTPPPVAPTAAPASLSGRLPDWFGRYRILQRLGGVSMGTVYVARDTQLDRLVALKVPRLTAEDGPELLQRFLRGAHAAATLDHPNICPVYEFGEIDGTPYLTMPYFRGESLAEIIRSGRPRAQRWVAEIARKLALAMQEAHKKGIIHRDLKPSNVMLNWRDEPVIIDFLLARRTNSEDPRLTVEGELLGTPAYMPPEQVKGEVHAMGPACDVYSLGVILYELLTGTVPFSGSMASILMSILTNDPAPPSTHRPDLDPVLETICLKAMAREIGDRYATMGDLAAALADFLRGKPQPDDDEDEEVRLVPGAIPIAGYELVKFLGRGGFGEVWQAIGPGGVGVALKFVRLGEVPGTVEPRALDLIRHIRHPQLLVLFGAWQRQDFLILAMELGDGNLLDRLGEAQRQGLPGIPREELLAYLRDAARGIDYLNGLGIQHRDIKPQNLFLVGGGVKVADFGLFRLREDLSMSSTTAAVAYVPPEVLTGNPSGPASDQYMLALSYIQLRTGALPFDVRGLHPIFSKTRGNLDLSRLPPEEQGVLKRATALDPAQRFPSCTEMVKALWAVRQMGHSGSVVDTRDAWEIGLPTDEPSQASPVAPPTSSPEAGPIPQMYIIGADEEPAADDTAGPLSQGRVGAHHREIGAILRRANDEERELTEEERWRIRALGGMDDTQGRGSTQQRETLPIRHQRTEEQQRIHFQGAIGNAGETPSLKPGLGGLLRRFLSLFGKRRE